MTEPRPPVVVVGQVARDLVLVVDVVADDGQWRYLGSVPDSALLAPTDIAPAADMLGKTAL